LEEELIDYQKDKTKEQKKDFLKRLEQNYGYIIEEDRTTEHLFRVVDHVKSLSESLDSCCDFKNGACVVNRDPNLHNEIIKEKNGCCSGCAQQAGYFRRIRKSDLNHLVSFWDSESGFLGKNGCKLPYQYRTLTCSSFICGVARKKAEKEKILTDFEISFLNKMYATDGL